MHQLATIENQLPATRHAANEDILIASWLHGRPASTRGLYLRVWACLRAFTSDAPLQSLTVPDLQAWLDSLAVADSTKHTQLAAIKSLYSYAVALGVLSFNIAAAVKTAKAPDCLSERIISTSEVYRLLAAARDAKGRLVLRLLYIGGLRVSELAGLRWRHVQDRGEQVQLSIHGKGGKVRPVLLPADLSRELRSIQGAPDDPIITSRKGGGALSVDAIQRIVAGAARRAGLPAGISPHWLRHAHASHALDAGCAVHDLQATLGHASLSTTSRYVHARPERSSALYLAG